MAPAGGPATLEPIFEERANGARSSATSSAGRPSVSQVQSALFCAAAILLTLTLSERYSLQYQRNVVDDAATSMQYAKNLALGNGLVFNVGERVEGYSNFLWVLFQTPLYALSHAFALSYE
ncbi:MAG TPA: hypothetical protein VGM29_18290, partial [Polyangiaceae bacterium]